MKRTKWQKPKLFVTEGNNPRWGFRYRDERGRQKREYAGFVASMNRREAERYAADFLDKINCPAPRVAKFRGTFKEFYEQIYVPERLSAESDAWKETTKRNIRAVIEARILPFFGHLELESIALSDVNAWLRGLRKPELNGRGRVVRRALNASTRGNLRTILSGILNHAIAHGAMSFNPCSLADVGRTGERREKKFLTPDQIGALVDRLNPSMMLMLKLSLSTGSRVSELLGLRWANVNLLDDEFRIDQRYCMGTFDTTKNRSASKSHVFRRLLEDFRQHRAANPDAVFVFESPRYPGAPYSYQSVQTALRKAAEDAGFRWPGFGWHTFRRMCVTVATATAGGAEAAKLVGKASEATIDPYILLQRDRVDEIVDKIQDRLLGGVQ